MSLPLDGLLGLGDRPPPLLSLLPADLAGLVLAPPLLRGLGVGQPLGYLLGAALIQGDMTGLGLAFVYFELQSSVCFSGGNG